MWFVRMISAVAVLDKLTSVQVEQQITVIKDEDLALIRSNLLNIAKICEEFTDCNECAFDLFSRIIYPISVINNSVRRVESNDILLGSNALEGTLFTILTKLICSVMELMSIDPSDEAMFNKLNELNSDNCEKITKELFLAYNVEIRENFNQMCS